MLYRCVIEYNTNNVIAIGRDENQGGQSYGGIGEWSNFVFSSIPTPPQYIIDYLNQFTELDNVVPVLKVVDNGLVYKTPEELGI